MKFAELDRVVLTRDLPAEKLRAGDVGIVVHAYADGSAVEVEVFSLTGATLAVATIPADSLRRVDARDVVSARPIAAE
jgi:phage terminase large subunit-like protein